MNTLRSLAKPALLLCALLAAFMTVSSSLAYLTARTGTLKNTFCVDVAAEAVRVPVHVRKKVTSLHSRTISPEGFRFALESEDGETITLAADRDGLASAELVFTLADLGKTHTYRLYEIDDGRENVIYSEAEYVIEIDVYVDSGRQIAAAARVNGMPAERIEAQFENVFAIAALPPTGDSACIGVHALLLAASAAGLALMKGRRSAWA